MARAEPAAAAPGPARDAAPPRNGRGQRCGAQRMLERERMRVNVRVSTRESSLRSRLPFAARSDEEQPAPTASPSHGREGARVGWECRPLARPAPGPALPLARPAPGPVLSLPHPSPTLPRLLFLPCPCPRGAAPSPPARRMGLGTAFPATKQSNNNNKNLTFCQN